MSATEEQTTTTEVSDRVATIALNRPDALNAWTRQLGGELHAAIDAAAADPDVRAIVITGTGRAFSSGADLRGDFQVNDAGKPDVLTALRDYYNPLLLRVREVPKPIVAAVNGPAVGIGASLALLADLVVAAESAYFLMAFANIGLGLDGGASAALVARAGVTRAAQIALLGDRIPAATALAWGLVNEVVPDGEVLTSAQRTAARLAAGAPGSYATIKRTLNAVAYRDLAELLELEAVLQQERANSEDFAEGVASFIERRPAQFSGR